MFSNWLYILVHLVYLLQIISVILGYIRCTVVCLIIDVIPSNKLQNICDLLLGSNQ